MAAATDKESLSSVSGALKNPVLVTKSRSERSDRSATDSSATFLASNFANLVRVRGVRIVMGVRVRVAILSIATL